MTRRRIPAMLAAAVLLAAAMIAGWRSMHRATNPAADLAAQLRCPSCQGESVAASRSPVAAAMREVIASQLAAGRSPAQVRAWFVERYGTDVLDEPPDRDVGLLLWLIPAGTLAAVVVLAARTARRRRGPPTGCGAPPPRRGPPGAVRARRICDLIAACLIGLVALMALTGPRAAGRADGGAAATDPAGAQLTLAQALERQGNFAAAAEAYREAASRRPDDQIRLRQAFALIRAGQPRPAAQIAEQVLAVAPDYPDALLTLGLAQRASGSPDAPATLRRFLRAAPNHPAAAEVSRLLSSS